LRFPNRQTASSTGPQGRQRRSMRIGERGFENLMMALPVRPE
jgi:hypothetical protein